MIETGGSNGLLTSPSHPAVALSRRTVVAGVAGTIGLLGLAFSTSALLEQAPPPPEIAALPFVVKVLLVIGNPLLFTWIAAWAGARFAHRVGLRFHAADAAVMRYRAVPGAVAQAVRRGGPVALLAGVLLGTGIALTDRLVLAPVLADEWRERIATQGMPDAAGAAMALLYGGITEEVMLRWGLLSAIAVLLRRLTRGPAEAGDVAARPGAGVMWVAILVSALVFAAGHLPAAAALGPLDVAATSRILLLNAGGGVLFGWMYWKRGLEAAIIAHVAAHLGMWAVASAMR